MAAAARSWLAAAILSWGSRSSPADAAYFSVPRPMAHWSKAQNRPSYIIESTTDLSPRRIAGAGVGQEVRGVGHGLHAAGDDDVGVAGLDHLVGQVDGVEAGQADLVDRGGRDAHGDAGVGGGLAGGDLARAGLDDVAHEDVVDLVGADAGPLERRRDGDTAEIGGGHRGESARQPPDGRPCAGDDHRSSHGYPLSTLLVLTGG